jgi:hypothetical protein
MEYNHKFSQVSSFNHKFGFDRSILDHQQSNTLVSLPNQEEEVVKETDISKEASTKTKRTKKTKK